MTVFVCPIIAGIAVWHMLTLIDETMREPKIPKMNFVVLFGLLAVVFANCWLFARWLCDLK